MEVKFYCSVCGTQHILDVENGPKSPDTVVNVTKRVIEHSSWRNVAESIRSGESNLSIGDELSCHLKNGIPVTFVAAAVNPYSENEVAFVIKDCLPIKRAMNKKCTNKGGWAMCDIRKDLNTEILALLPDDLVEVIKLRTIVQVIDGEEFKATSKRHNQPVISRSVYHSPRLR